jgi:hypothetical protein
MGRETLSSNGVQLLSQIQSSQRTTMAKKQKKPAPRAQSKAPAKQRPSRLPTLALDNLTSDQQALVDEIKSGPRGQFNN